MSAKKLPPLPARRRRISPQTIGFVLTSVVLLLYLTGNRLLDVLESKTYDERLQSHARRAPAGDVVIAAIDEKSLATLGRWPWSRGTMARLVQQLDKQGARVIVFDVFFSETENGAVLEQINRLEAEQGFANSGNSPFSTVKRALAADSSFGQAIAKSGKVVLATVFLMSEDEARHQSQQDSARAFASIQGQAIQTIKDSGGGRLDFPMAAPAGLVVNLPELARRARSAGHINSLSDLDGTVRWSPLVIKYQGLFFASADIQAVRLYKENASLALHTSEYGITGIEIGNQFVPTDENGRALVRYHGPAKTFNTISIADIYTGKVGADALRNKIVIIGATAQGVGDIRVTPYGASYPGVEIRANTMQNLIDNDFNYRPGWMFVFEFGIVLALGLGLSFGLPRVGVRNAALITVGLLGLYIALALVLFRTQHVWLNVVYPTLLILVLFVYTTIAKYFTAESEKRQIKGAFAHYVPAAVVDEIVSDIDRLALGGEKRELTVLFSDIRGFTGMAETLAPEELVQLLNVYLTQMTEKVFKHDGLLDKYIGDAIMAVYGAPIHRAEHARLACHTALDMLRTLNALQGQWKQQGLPTIDIGIGINTGPMVVGNMGSTDRFNYTVIGDAVNLASRVESLNKIYGTRILLSEGTYRAVKDDFSSIREIDLAQVRGRQERVRVYELMLPEHFADMDWVADFARAYHLFHSDDRTGALPIFQALAEAINDPVSRYYVQRCHTPQRRSADFIA